MRVCISVCSEQEEMPVTEFRDSSTQGKVLQQVLLSEQHQNIHINLPVRDTRASPEFTERNPPFSTAGEPTLPYTETTTTSQVHFSAFTFDTSPNSHSRNAGGRVLRGG